MTVPHHSESLRPFLSYFFWDKGLGNRTIFTQNNIFLFCQQVIRQVPSRGVLVAPSPVFLVFVVVALIDQVRVPMVTCVAEGACSPRPRSGAVGIGRSTLTRNAMLCVRLLPLLASLPWLCPKVIIFQCYFIFHTLNDEYCVSCVSEFNERTNESLTCPYLVSACYYHKQHLMHYFFRSFDQWCPWVSSGRFRQGSGIQQDEAGRCSIASLACVDWCSEGISFFLLIDGWFLRDEINWSVFMIFVTISSITDKKNCDLFIGCLIFWTNVVFCV